MIFLIRHGESEANVGLPTCRPECGGLTQRGREQARAIADFLRNYPPDLIVTSPYIRAKQTLEAALSLLPDTARKVPIEEVPSVREFTYLAPGRWASSTVEERRPEVGRYWQDAKPEDVDGPGAESFSAFIDRVHTFLEQAGEMEREYENIAVFSHEQFINAVLWLKDHTPEEVSSQAMRDFRTLLDRKPIPNGAIVQLKYSNHDGCWNSEVITWHLKAEALVATD